MVPPALVPAAIRTRPAPIRAARPTLLLATRTTTRGATRLKVGAIPRHVTKGRWSRTGHENVDQERLRRSALLVGFGAPERATVKKSQSNGNTVRTPPTPSPAPEDAPLTSRPLRVAARCAGARLVCETPRQSFLSTTRNGVEIHGSFTGPEPEVNAGRVGISHGVGPWDRFELQRVGDVGKAADLRDLCGAPSGSREVRRVDLRRLACRVPRRRRSTGRCGLGAEAACTGLTCPYALRQQKKRQGQDGQGVVALAFDPSDRCDTNPLPANARRHDCPPANADAFSR